MSRFAELTRRPTNTADNISISDPRAETENAKVKSLHILNEGFKVVEDYYKEVLKKDRPDLIPVGSLTDETKLFIPVDVDNSDTHRVERFSISFYHKKGVNNPALANPIDPATPEVLQMPTWNEYVHGEFTGAVIKPWNGSFHAGGKDLRPEFIFKVRGTADVTNFQAKVGQVAMLATITDQNGDKISKVNFLPNKEKPNDVTDVIADIIEVLHPLFVDEQTKVSQLTTNTPPMIDGRIHEIHNRRLLELKAA